MSGGDAIDVYNSALVIGGEGSITLRTEWSENYSGDGIDVVGGSLTINGGTFFIYSSDNGIEVEGETTINGGLFYIDAEDDGFEIEDTVINHGVFYIDSEEDDGIEAHGLTINGGSFNIYSYENAIEANGTLTIGGGSFDLKADYACFYSSEGAAFNGGSFLLEAREDTPVIYGYESLTFSDAFGEVNVLLNDEGQYYVVDENGDALYNVHLKQVDNVKAIYRESISYNNFMYYNGEPQTPEIAVYDYESDELLTLGVDYTVTRISPVSKESGVYLMLVSGIGSYTGSIIIDYTIHEC
jgi:hypothetical protein